MKHSRRQLGLLGVGSLLALVASSLSAGTAEADPAPTSGSTVTVTKSMSPAGPVANGATVTATLTITGPSPVPVTITDYHDYGLTYVSDSNVNCNNVVAGPADNGSVVCNFATLPANTVVTITYVANYVGPKVFSFWRTSDERMEIQKKETHVTLAEDDITTFSVSCDPGYKLLDFAFHKQWVDQDEGDLEHIRVISTDVWSPTEYRVTLENTSTGQAQGKIWAVCMKTTTNFGTTVTFDPLQEVTTTLHPEKTGEPRPLYAYCDPGETPMAVDVRAVKDPAHPTASNYSDGLISQHGLESDGGLRTRVWVEVLEPAKVTLEWHCMKTTTSSGRNMQFDLVTGSKTVAAGAKDQKKLTCPDGFKGIVGGWTGGKINGHEPQPVSRVYWFYNQTGAAKTYDLYLLCVRSRVLKDNRLEYDSAAKEVLLNYASGVEKTSVSTHKWIAPAKATIQVLQ